MFKSIVSYLLGFLAGILFILGIVKGNWLSAIIPIVITIALAIFISIKIHTHMKSKYEKQRRGAYKHANF